MKQHALLEQEFLSSLENEDFPADSFGESPIGQYLCRYHCRNRETINILMERSRSALLKETQKIVFTIK